MKFRVVLTGICLSLAVSLGSAQSPEPAKPAPAADQPKPAKRAIPPDMKAYGEAYDITDPEKRIAALEKFRHDFANSALVETAGEQILSTLVKRRPGQQDRIRDVARMLYKATPPKDKGRLAAQIAEELSNANLLLKDAEMYARKSLASMRLARYLAQERKSYAEDKETAPSEQELSKRFRQNRALRLGTLGCIEVKLGKAATSRKLLEYAYAVNPNQPAVAAALGDLAAREGNDDKALDLLIAARLSGRSPESANQALGDLYRKRHGGSLADFDAMLDNEYHKRFPNPLHLEPYKPTEKRSDRLVLAELFTGAACGPCVGADLAFDAAIERYSLKNLALLVYHQHIPYPDPMTNPDTQARATSYDVHGVPTFAIDGKKSGGGGGREYTKNVFERFNPDIEKELESPAEARLKLETALSGNTVRVKAAAADVKSDSKDLKLQIALVERELRYTGENGIRFHPMVVRALGGPKAEGFVVDPGKEDGFEQVFDLDKISAALKAHLDDYEAKGRRGETFKFSEKKYQINPADLAVVAFVQDDKTRHVLQAAYVDLKPEPGTPTDGTASK